MMSNTIALYLHYISIQSGLQANKHAGRVLCDHGESLGWGKESLFVCSRTGTYTSPKNINLISEAYEIKPI